MNEKQSASQIRLIDHAVELTTRRLAGDPIAQAEAIARHYASHAQLAFTMLRLIESVRRYSGSGVPAVNEVIQSMAGQIKSAHLHDFGLFLDWVSPVE